MPKADPASTTSNNATSAIYNHPGRLFCTCGAACVGESTVCPGACCVSKGAGGVVEIGVLAETVRGGCVIGAVGIYCSGVCCADVDPVGVIGKTGVEDDITGDGGRAGVLLPTLIGGTDDAFDSDCCDDLLGYVGLFIVS